MGDGKRVRPLMYGLASEVDAFLRPAIAGDSVAAVSVALKLLDNGVPERLLITDLLAPVQIESGRRWMLDQLSVAEEHLVSGCVEAALHALAATISGRERHGHVVLACPEGDWHSIPAHMFSLQLQYEAFGVRFLGPSSPADHVGRILAQRPADALVVCCTMLTSFAGVLRLAAAAHAEGIPVLVGGGALTDGQEKVELLGGDAWAPDLDSAVAVLRQWREAPPAPRPDRPALPACLLELDRTAEVLATIAWERLVETCSSAVAADGRIVMPARQDLALVIRALAAALLVRSDSTFLGFLRWLEQTLTVRGVPRALYREGLESVVVVLPAAAPGALRLMELAIDGLAAAEAS